MRNFAATQFAGKNMVPAAFAAACFLFALAFAANVFAQAQSRVGQSVDLPCERIINLLAVVLYCVNFWLRLHRVPGDDLPIVLSVIGVVAIIISGWLGGEMVYVRGVAVKQPPDQRV
jgi:uncharacterized membrane protein